MTDYRQNAYQKSLDERTILRCRGDFESRESQKFYSRCHKTGSFYVSSAPNAVLHGFPQIHWKAYKAQSIAVTRGGHGKKEGKGFRG